MTVPQLTSTELKFRPRAIGVAQDSLVPAAIGPQVCLVRR